MKSVNLIFPHQLFEKNPLLKNKHPVYLVEEFLFFKQYAFHQQKIAFHRASMKFYESYLLKKSSEVHYIDSSDPRSDIRALIKDLSSNNISSIHYIDPTDNWLEKRIQSTAAKVKLACNQYSSPLFLNTPEAHQDFFKPTKKKFYQTSFYKQQRKEKNILLDNDREPTGGKWSFDAENRKKYPRKKTPPPIEYPVENDFYKEAKEYVAQHYSDNPGTLNDFPLYPTDFKSTAVWFQQFLENRFHEFGTYEDAIVAKHYILNHSVLTPMLNVGLISPALIIEQTLKFAEENKVPINSVEGFIRQIIGWREFIRGIYEVKGTEERTKNFWGFERKIPASFYDGSTGIVPVDNTIKKVLETGYCHHIERLMVLGNFMLLCEFDPDEVYRWFMELFVDAYDWVMVPNVYGMSQFADGGLMSSKPYISGSNYLMKMSDYPKGDWQETWDALFWRFMDVNRDFFLKNPRLGMLIGTFDKMSEEKQEALHAKAGVFLEQL